MIVDVRCSPQFAKPQDITGSESSQKLQALEKHQKRLQSDIETLKAKEGVLRDVLVAYASSDAFDFETALDTFDEKKAHARASLEVLAEELANVEQEIREVGVGQTGHRYGALTGRMARA
jgi:predicted  nucleic acid-binding Zn-ribbon protein